MPSVNFTFRGLMAPVFTPFHCNDERSLDLSMIPEYGKFLLSNKITGVLVNGTTGEGPSLTIDERKQVAEVWAEVCRETKQHLMIQVGGASLKDVKELAAHAEKIGADSILCLPELFYKPFGVEQLIDYLEVVSTSAKKTPLLYYHIPMMTNINIHMAEFFKAIGNRVSTFVGIKFTHTDLQELSQALAVNSDFRIFLGSDVLMTAGCALGIDSFIMTTLNFYPQPALKILKYGTGKINLKEAQNQQNLLTNVVTDVVKYGNWIESMKMVMNLHGLNVGPPRAPNKLINHGQVLNRVSEILFI